MPNLSNYPPGVTGMEPQIRGYAERTETRTCEAQTNLMIKTPLLARFISELADGLNNDNIAAAVSAARRVVREASDIEYEIDDATCPFEGEVDISYDQGLEWWECPVCGTEHEEEVDYEVDPDAERDRLLDL